MRQISDNYRRTPVLVISSVATTYFNSITAASKHTGLNPNSIVYHIRNGKPDHNGLCYDTVFTEEDMLS